MRKIITILFLSLLGLQCLEPFEFEPNVQSEEKILVIDGQLTASSGPHFVRLSYTRAFGEKFSEPISGAEVKLINQSNTYSYLENGDGDYQLDNFAGVIGDEYILEVQMPSGKTFRSKPATMPNAVKADSVYHEFDRDVVVGTTGIERIAPVLNVFVDTKLPDNDIGNSSYMRWYTDELYIFAEEPCGGLHIPKACYVKIEGNPQNIALFSSENISGNRLSGLKVSTKTYLPNFQFKTALFFSVYQYVINKDAYEYWEKLKSLTSQSGTVFDLPPATLRGNMENINDPNEAVLGYFELATTDTVRTKVFGVEYMENVNRIVYCSQFNRRNWPEECCQCLVLENSSPIRPSWLDN